MELFIVDSNFFIEAHRVTYPLDIATGFWSKVKELADAGIIVSIDKVKKELYDKNDALENWCRANLPDDFFKSTTEVLGEYAQVSAWALNRNNHYMQKALNEFLDADEADAFLISYALNKPLNRVIVTQEISAPQKKSRIKIPDCCNALGVNYMNTIGMFRKLGQTF